MREVRLFISLLFRFSCCSRYVAGDLLAIFIASGLCFFLAVKCLKTILISKFTKLQFITRANDLHFVQTASTRAHIPIHSNWMSIKQYSRTQKSMQHIFHSLPQLSVRLMRSYYICKTYQSRARMHRRLVYK